MNEQTLFNMVVGVAGALGGWMLKVIWEAIKDLQKTDKELAEKVTGIEVLVAGKYATREEVQRGFEAILKRLDHISEQLSGKADR